MTRENSTTDNQPDPDAHLSDHQWRMKMAAEGKALYVSGRDTDHLRARVQSARTAPYRPQAKAAMVGGPVIVPLRPMPDYPDAISPIEAWEQAQAAQGNQAKTPEQQEPAMINFSVTEDQYRRFEQATGEAPYLLAHAGHVFDFLVSVKAAGFTGDESGVLAIMDLCARAFRNAAAQEGEALAELDQVMRHDWAAQHKQSLQQTVQETDT